MDNLELGKNIKTRHLFALAFGCIIGIGWIILLGAWLEQGGPLGAMIAFTFGALLMLLIGLCYAEVATMLPAAGGEVVFSYEISGTKSSFAMGWFLALSFVATISFEAISAGWIISAMIPGVEGKALYMSGGEPVKLGVLLIGVVGMALLFILNYRGTKSAATFQEIMTYLLIVISLVFMAAGIIWGKIENLEPLFAKTGTLPVLGGIASVFILVPFMLSGFEVIPQSMEEIAPGTSLKTVGRIILISIGAALVFYLLVILASSMVVPWKKLIALDLPAAGAFEAAFKSALMTKTVLFAGLCGIITTWNPCFIVASRIIFALGRARIIPPVLGKIHPVFKSPFVAVIFVGITSTIGVFLGKSAVVPVANVAAATIAVAYGSTCLVMIKLRRSRPDAHRPYRVRGGSVVGIMGFVGCIFLVFLALYQPWVDAKGAFPLEWTILIIWSILGILFWFFARKIRSRVSEEERYKLLLAASANTPSSKSS